MVLITTLRAHYYNFSNDRDVFEGSPAFRNFREFRASFLFVDKFIHMWLARRKWKIRSEACRTKSVVIRKKLLRASPVYHHTFNDNDFSRRSLAPRMPDQISSGEVATRFKTKVHCCSRERKSSFETRASCLAGLVRRTKAPAKWRGMGRISNILWFLEHLERLREPPEFVKHFLSLAVDFDEKPNPLW